VAQGRTMGKGTSVTPKRHSMPFCRRLQAGLGCLLWEPDAEGNLDVGGQTEPYQRPGNESRLSKGSTFPPHLFALRDCGQHQLLHSKTAPFTNIMSHQDQTLPMEWSLLPSMAARIFKAWEGLMWISCHEVQPGPEPEI